MNKRLSIAAVVFALSCFGCGGGAGEASSRSGWADDGPPPRRKEIVSPTVLSVQLAMHREIESRTRFTGDEPVDASLFLTNAEHVESRRINASLECGESLIEEQSVWLAAEDERREFDFRFAKMGRPPGDCEIRFVEIARSSGKPVLLARLFLTVE